MTDRLRQRAPRPLALAAVVFGSLALAACQTGGGNSPTASAALSSGAPRAIAFESIDGPPEPVFNKLVANLSTAADARQIRVVSRNGEAAYRVRGYLAASVEGDKGSVDWVWDVFDKDRERVLRVAGVEAVGKGKDVWNQVDDATLQRIATQSLDEIGSRLAGNPSAPVRSAPAAAPATEEAPDIRADDGPQVASTAPAPADADPDETLPAAAEPTVGATALTFAAHP